MQTIKTNPSASGGIIPEEGSKELETLFINNIDSFNFLIEHGLKYLVEDIPPVEVLNILFILIVYEGRFKNKVMGFKCFYQ